MIDAWTIRGCTALLAGALLLGTAASRRPATDTEERMRFYQARIAGPGTYPAYARLGAAYLQKARETGEARYYAVAEHSLRQSLRFQPNQEALRWLAGVYLARHQFEEALACAQQAVESLPEDQEAQGALFDAYLGLRDEQSAAAVAHRMMETRPGFGAWIRLASLQEFRGELARAIHSAKRACDVAEAERSPRETRAWCQVRIGTLRSANARRDQARQAFRRALEIFPDYFLAQRHLGFDGASTKRADCSSVHAFRCSLQ
jgi:tetratricopeptide (TPR) repeat protein